MWGQWGQRKGPMKNVKLPEFKSKTNGHKAVIDSHKKGVPEVPSEKSAKRSFKVPVLKAKGVAAGRD